MADLVRANNFQGWHLATSAFGKHRASSVASGPAALLPGTALLYESQGCSAYEKAFQTRVNGADDMMDKCAALSRFYSNCIVKCRLFATSEETKFSQTVVDALKRSGFAPNGMELAETRDGEITRSLKEDLQKWVNQITNGLIPKFDFRFGADNTILTVVSFKGNWKSPFDTSSTIDRPFSKINGDVCKVATMLKEHRRAKVDRYFVDAAVSNAHSALSAAIVAQDETFLAAEESVGEQSTSASLIPALRLSLALADGSEVMLAYPESAYHNSDELMQLLPQILVNITTHDVTPIYCYGDCVHVQIPKMNITSETDVLETHNIVDLARSFKMTTTFQMDEAGVRGAAASYVATDGIHKINQIYFDRPFAFSVTDKQGLVSFCGYFNA